MIWTPDTQILRPQPPDCVLDEDAAGVFVRSRELEDWLRWAFIEGTSPLVNEEHSHLQMARIGCLWTNIANKRHMATIVGQEEMLMPKSGWGGARATYQIESWFDMAPDFLLTFYAPYCETCDDLSFCALVEHECYHCGQQQDRYGAPKFKKSGAPVFGLKAHDVEEHVGIARRYGLGGCAGKSREFVDAANRMPLIGRAEIAGACGTAGCKVL